MKITIFDRILLLMTGLLAAYQVASGINGLEEIPIIAYTIAFGVLLLAGLLLMILGLEALDSPIVVIVSTIIPISMSLGLIWQYIPKIGFFYLLFTILGLLAIILSRTLKVKKTIQILILASIHGVAGLIIFLLPSIFAAKGICRPGFALVGLGGALISIAGLLLSFLKTGKPILPRETIFRILPSLLLLMTISFVIGFATA